jgi:argininosuccinate lyase
LLTVMKGLPLAYQKDMQEDKEGAIDALGALMLSINAMTGMVRDMAPDVARMRQPRRRRLSTATDLADWLVRTLKLPFREAHHVTGRIVAKAAESGVRSTSCRSRPCRRSSPRHQGGLRRALGRGNP